MVAMFERIVLPRPNDHGLDLLNLWRMLQERRLEAEAKLWSLIVDFKDAFMSTGTIPEEQRFVTALGEDPESPSGYWYYVWHTLGFGGENVSISVCAASVFRRKNRPSTAYTGPGLLSTLRR